jgi:hypothetical protein
MLSEEQHAQIAVPVELAVWCLVRLHPVHPATTNLAPKKTITKKTLLTMTSATLAQSGRVNALSSPLIAVTSSTREHCRIRRARSYRRSMDLSASNRCSAVGYKLPLVQHGVRRVVQQPGIRAMRIELDDLGQPPVSAPNDGDAGAIALSIMLPRPSRCTGIRV